MTQQAVTSGGIARQWIIGARWDAFICLSTIWLPGVTYLVWRGAGAPDARAGEVLGAICVATLTIPHFLTSFTFNYMDVEERGYHRRQPLLYYGVPAVLVIGAWIHCAVVGPVLLMTIWLLFGEHHVAGQNRVLLGLYRERNGEGALDRRIDRFAFDAAWVATVCHFALGDPASPTLLYYETPVYTIPFADRDILVGILALVATGGFVAFLLRQGQRWWTGEGVNVPKLLFMITAWPSFFVVPFVVRDMQLAVVLRIGYHSIQYLGLSYLINRRRVASRRIRRPDLADGPLERLVARGPAGFFLAHVLIGVVVWFMTDVYALHSGWANDISLRFIFLPGVPLAHFFLDGLTWRFHAPHVRETVLPYLGREEPTAAPPASAGGGGAHAHS